MTTASTPDETPVSAPQRPAAATSVLRAHIFTDPAWRLAWIVYLVGSAALLALFWQNAVEAVDIWYESATFNHAFLILPICVYVMILRRDTLARFKPTPCFPALLLLALIGPAWLLGNVASVRVVQQFLLVAALILLFVTIFGWRIAWANAFPLGYLFFLVPIGDFLVPPLQVFTAEFVVSWIELFNIPVFLDGVFISIPEGKFEVAEACAGLRFLIATLALGFLFANLTYTSMWRRAVFIALAIIVPVIANGFRAFGIVLTGHLSDMKVAVGVDHIIYGWLFFSIVTVILLAVGMTFRDKAIVDEVAESAAPSKAQPGLSGPLAGSVVAAGLLAVIISGAAPTYAGYLDSLPTVQLAEKIVPPPSINGWELQETYKGTWKPVFEGADRSTLVRYTKDGKNVDLFIAYYARQRQGAEIVSYKNLIADGKIWHRAGGNGRVIEVEGTSLEVERTRILTTQRGRITWSWYWIDNRFNADRYLSKVLQALAKLFGRSEVAAVVIIGTDFREQAREADAVLTRFVAEIGSLSKVLGAVARK